MAFLVFIILLIGSNLTGLQDRSEVYHILVTDAVFTDDQVINLSRDAVWYYKAGDDTTWASTNIDIADWKEIDVRLSADELPENWTGNAWFTTYLDVDSLMFGKRITMTGNANGALEFYLNGKRVQTIGQIGDEKETEQSVIRFRPFQVELENTKTQQLTLRFSNHSVEPSWYEEDTGFKLWLANADIGVAAYEQYLSGNHALKLIQLITIGAVLTLMLLHFFIYLNYLRERLNLVLGIYMLFLGLTGVTNYWRQISNTPQYFYTYAFYDSLFIVAVSIVGLLVTYMIIKRKLDWVFALLFIAGFIILVQLMIDPTEYRPLAFSYFVTTIFIYGYFFIYTRIRNDRADLNILISTFVVFFLLFLPRGIALITNGSISILWAGNNIVISLSILVFPIGFSFYAAQKVAKTNIYLREKLRENRKLSSEKIEAEQDKKQILSKQKEHLKKEVEKRTQDLKESLEQLKSTQSQLIQQEKLASLGQLTAGIAHEIKNPLNFVNNFSELSLELVEEVRDEIRDMRREMGDDESKKAQAPLSRVDGIAEGDGRGVSSRASDESFDPGLLLDILDDIEANLKTIHKHGSRADSIVKSMLQHSRGGDGEMEPILLNPLIKEYVNLCFHGMRASKNPINVDIDLQLDEDVGEVPLVAEDFSRVILNLVNNAFDAMREKQGAGLEVQGTGGYEPKLTVRTKSEGNSVTIEVEDNGPGIPEEMKDKILQPFFTTKKGTDGTGLGLSITNDIIKAHGGDLEIRSEPTVGTTFIIKLTK